MQNIILSSTWKLLCRHGRFNVRFMKCCSTYANGCWLMSTFFFLLEDFKNFLCFVLKRLKFYSTYFLWQCPMFELSYLLTWVMTFECVVCRKLIISEMSQQFWREEILLIKILNLFINEIDSAPTFCLMNFFRSSTWNGKKSRFSVTPLFRRLIFRSRKKILFITIQKM